MCQKVLQDYPNWTQISLGKLLRYFANIEDDGEGLNSRIKSSVSAGDFVNRDVVLDIVYAEMKKTKYTEADGIVIDGFPREMSQLIDFENKVSDLGKRLMEETGDKKAAAFLTRRIFLAIQRRNSAAVVGTLLGSSNLEEVFLCNIHSFEYIYFLLRTYEFR
jgi:Adenylate kinase and related kinases